MNRGHETTDLASVIKAAGTATTTALKAKHTADRAAVDAERALSMAKTNRLDIGDLSEALGKIAAALSQISRSLDDIASTNTTVLELLQRLQPAGTP